MPDLNLILQRMEDISHRDPAQSLPYEVTREYKVFRGYSKQSTSEVIAQIDPTRANINWEEFRERQRDAAMEAVRSALVLDEIARRDSVVVSDADMQAEIDRYAERAGLTPEAVRARLEQEGGLARL